MDRKDNIPESGWRRDLFEIIFEAETPTGKFFDVILLWAIGISVACVVLESETFIRLQYGTWLDIAEWTFTILFTIEYILRLIVIQRKRNYIFSFFGIIDLISILPTYLTIFFPSAHSLMVIRAFRLLRIFRVLKFARYVKESNILLEALRNSAAKILVFLGTVMTIVLIMGTVMYLIEGHQEGFSSILRGMYWAVITLTTVGYGDVVPITGLGKFISSAIMIMGYGIIAVPTGIVSVEMQQAVQGARENICPQCGKNVSN